MDASLLRPRCFLVPLLRRKVWVLSYRPPQHLPSERGRHLSPPAGMASPLSPEQGSSHTPRGRGDWEPDARALGDTLFAPLADLAVAASFFPHPPPTPPAPPVHLASRGLRLPHSLAQRHKLWSSRSCRQPARCWGPRGTVSCRQLGCDGRQGTLPLFGPAPPGWSPLRPRCPPPDSPAPCSETREGCRIQGSAVLRASRSR